MDNIRWGKADATDEEVIQAAKIAQADEFVSNLTEGYQTVIGEKGASLSGGIGTALNTYLGALIIGWIRNILNLMGVASYPQMIIKGLIIILAVLSQGLVGGTIATGLFKKRPAKDNKRRNTLK